MGYADILCLLDTSEESTDRLRIAATLAAAHGARLTGVDATAGEVSSAATAELGARFEEAANAYAVTANFIPSGLLDAALFIHSCTDLIVAPSPGGPSRAFTHHGLIERALTESGAPVLMTPAGLKIKSVGETAIVAWNGAREALRAVHDALPILKRAGAATVFAFSSRPGTLRESARHLIEHLRRHGVAANLADWTNAGGLSPVEALLACAEDRSADLIVAGAFGHSRLYEEIFGGVSIELLRQQSAPLLMSH